jgi:GDPmannose 4,6-dehydratase
MIAEMVAADLELAKRRALLQRHGYHTPMSIEA